MVKIGCARTDITVYEPGMCMLGWAHKDNTAEGVAMPLSARAFVLEDPADGGRVALVIAEICFVTEALRQAVLDEVARRPAWRLSDERVVLSATHTHSSPSGYSHHVFYASSSSGVSERVFRGLVDGIVSAIDKAVARLAPGRVHVRSGEIPASEPVAFNRVIHAYEANPDVIARTGVDYSPTALDREMTVLRFDDAAGRPLGLLSWFGVHGTSVHRESHLLHPDNKGLAAAWVERWAAEHLDAPGFVAAFAQAPCGDVTPNRNFSARRGLAIGEHPNDFEAARICGEIQARFAKALFEDAVGEGLEPRLDAALMTADFADLCVDAAHADGSPGRRTAPAVVGLRMIFGTREGPGASALLGPIIEKATQAHARWSRWRGGADGDPQAPKIPLLQLGLGTRGKALGIQPMSRPFPLPDGVDPTVGFFNRILADGAVDDRPWAPHVLPAQLVIIGDLAIAATAGELTTVAGRRLRAGLLERLKARGVRRVVSMPYSNAYAGYITTHEEYVLQGYEGGHTLFGRWTLAGHRTLFDRVAERLMTKPTDRSADRGPVPARADPALLERWAFRGR